MGTNYVTKYFSNDGTRNEVRMRVVDTFSSEFPGTGNKDLVSKYIYYVENLKSGSRIYLQRPANLHNGFDFLVCVENINFAHPHKQKRNSPKHADLAHDLQIKKEENFNMYCLFFKLLSNVYNCKEVEDSDMENIYFSSGYSVDCILKTLKWLFIEQDIRYWNYSGREMTWGIIPKP